MFPNTTVLNQGPSMTGLVLNTSKLLLFCSTMPGLGLSTLTTPHSSYHTPPKTFQMTPMITATDHSTPQKTLTDHSTYHFTHYSIDHSTYHFTGHSK